MSVDLERVNIAGKVDKYWILDIKRPQLRSILHAFGAEGMDSWFKGNHLIFIDILIVAVQQYTVKVRDGR